MQVALAVGVAVDDGLDVIAGPGVAGTERAAAAEIGVAAAKRSRNRGRTLGTGVSSHRPIHSGTERGMLSAPLRGWPLARHAQALRAPVR